MGLATLSLTRSSSRFRTMAYSHGAHNEDTLQRENVSDSSDQSLSQGKDEGAVYRENVVESNETDLAPAHDGFQKEVLETADPHFTVSKEREQKLIRKLDIRTLPMIMWMYLMSFMDRVIICRQTLRRGRGPESWTEPVSARRVHLVRHILYFRNTLELDHQASEPGVLPMWIDFLLGHHCYFHGFRSKSWRSTCLPSSSGNL